jgi:hypothetical protein
LAVAKELPPGAELTERAARGLGRFVTLHGFRSTDWRITLLNLAGSVAFGVSGSASVRG